MGPVVRTHASPRSATFRWAMAAAIAFLCGCGGGPQPTRDLTAFANAGPLWPEVELRNLAQTNGSATMYQVGPRDVLELHMPAAMQSTGSGEQGTVNPTPFLCRVSQAGTITLPIVGELHVAQKTPCEIESAIANAYYPEYLVAPPSVLVLVNDYHTVSLSISGAVQTPGVYAMRSNECTLMCLLMKAGGIGKEGARTIRVQCETAGDLVLPVYGLRFPPADVVLQGGESVLVEQVEPEIFTVIGLVRKPGAYPYPPGARYNLMQAVAMAGGVNEVADPRYAKVYRNGGDGNVRVGCFQICEDGATCASQVVVKPGDVIALEHTARTRARVVLAEMLRVGAGLNVGVGASYRLPPD